MKLPRSSKRPSRFVATLLLLATGSILAFLVLLPDLLFATDDDPGPSVEATPSLSGADRAVNLAPQQQNTPTPTRPPPIPRTATPRQNTPTATTRQNTPTATTRQNTPTSAPPTPSIPTNTAIATQTPTSIPPVMTTITTQGGSLGNQDGDITIIFPANAVSQTVTLTYQELQAPLQPAPADTVAIRSFTLEARTSAGQLVTEFAQPYTLTFSYTDAELAEHGINETALNIAFWNGQIWVILLPCEGCEVDTINNRVTVILDHFTEFALFGRPGAAERRLYLPLVRQ